MITNWIDHRDQNDSYMCCFLKSFFECSLQDITMHKYSKKHESEQKTSVKKDFKIIIMTS
jgi:hypothetical protein